MKEYLSFKNCSDFLTQIQVELCEDGIDSFLVSSINPLKTIILIMHLNKSLVAKLAFIRIKVERINSQLIYLGKKIIDSMTSPRDVEIMLLDTTYHGWEVIEMISDLNLIELLECPVIDNVLSNVWQGPYE